MSGRVVSTRVAGLGAEIDLAANSSRGDGTAFSRLRRVHRCVSRGGLREQRGAPFRRPQPSPQYLPPLPFRRQHPPSHFVWTSNTHFFAFRLNDTGSTDSNGRTCDRFCVTKVTLRPGPCAVCSSAQAVVGRRTTAVQVEESDLLAPASQFDVQNTAGYITPPSPKKGPVP